MNENIWDFLKAPSPSAKMPPELELLPQARQQDPSGSMGMGIIEPDIFDLEYLPKNIEGLDKNLKEIVEGRKKRGERLAQGEDVGGLESLDFIFSIITFLFIF